MTKSLLGSLATQAPEILERQKYDVEVDMYSLGVIFYQWLMGIYPYVGSKEEVLKQMRSGSPSYEMKNVTVSL
jgi:serine/threonine protein kinase